MPDEPDDRISRFAESLVSALGSTLTFPVGPVGMGAAALVAAEGWETSPDNPKNKHLRPESADEWLARVLAESANKPPAQINTAPGFSFNSPYQVQANDKDFLTLAANLGANYNQLRAANPYVQSLSQGQWLNVPQTTGYLQSEKGPGIGTPQTTRPPALGAGDPLAGTAGHYYVDEKTAPLVGQIITRADGSRRRLLTDKNGRLYYGKIGQNRRGREKRRAQRLALEQAQIVPTPEVRDAPVTALNVIMGS